MRIAKKIIITLLCLVLLAIGLNYGASYYITKKLPSIIQADKNFPYNISYKDLDVNLIAGSFTAYNVYVAPKDSTDTQLSQGAFGEIKTITVQRFNLWALLREDKIKVKRVIIDSPNIQLYEKDKKYNVEDDAVKPFKNIIHTGSLEIRNGRFKLLDTLQKPLLTSANINLEVRNIRIDSAIVKQDIPVRYTDYTFSCDSLFYKANDVYNITAKSVSSTDSTVAIKNFRLIPQYTRVQYTRMLAKEKDLFIIQVKDIAMPKVQWGYYRDTLFVHSPKVVLDNLAANVYRSKEPADDPTRKKLYSELLRTLDFDLKVDALQVKNSFIEYEEQLTFARPAAKVTFSKFNANVANVYSPVNKDKLPTTAINARCMFMKTSPLSVNWTFNVRDASDAFTMKGDLRQLKSKNLDKLSQPLMNISTDSEIKQVKFTINGNREFATGTFAIHYDNMKVAVYKKDGKEKNKFMTAVGNLIVKNDSKDELKQTDIRVDRLKDKSVFNFMWRFLQEGLKQTLLPKAVTTVLPMGGKKK